LVAPTPGALVIFATADEAWAYGESQAHIFEALEALSDGTFRVILEALSDAPVPPGQDVPETAPLPEGVTVLSSVSPEYPAHLEKLETALARFQVPHRDPVKRAEGEREPKWPPISPFWRKTIARAYFFRKPQVVFRVGRRGGKSSTLSRAVAAEVLYGDHHVPGGDTGVFAIISQDRDNAKNRITTIDEIFSDLQVDHKTLTNEIRVASVNREVKIFTASVAGVSGFTAIGCLCDEVSKWKDKDSEVNPGFEVLESLRPTMATQPNAMMWLISSPWSTGDAHYEAFEAGTSEGQTCFYAPTWIANPTPEVSEERCRRLALTEQEFEREYKAIPMATEENRFFPADRIKEAQEITFSLHDTARKGGGDLAFRRNSSALCILEHGKHEDARGAYRLLLDREWIPTSKSLRPGDVFSDMIGDLKKYDAETVCTDLHYIESLREELEATDINLQEFPTNQEGIGKAFLRVRYLLSHGRISLALASQDLIRQLGSVRMVPTAQGMSFKSPETGGKHGDIASAFVCALWAFESEGSAGMGGERRFGEDHNPAEWHEYADEAFPD
jgi:hypothetical protein